MPFPPKVIEYFNKEYKCNIKFSQGTCMHLEDGIYINNKGNIYPCDFPDITSEFIKKVLFISYIFINLIYCITNISIPYLTGKYIDYVFVYRTKYRVFQFVFVLALFFIVSIVSYYIKSILYAKITANLTFYLISRVFRHIKKLSILYFKNINSSYLNDRINSDCNDIVNFLMDNLIEVFINIFSIFVYLIFLYSLDTKFLITALIIIPLYIGKRWNIPRTHKKSASCKVYNKNVGKI